MSLISVPLVLADIIANITNLIVQGIDASEHEKEEQFTQQVCEQVRQQLPTMNVMVVHGQFTSNFVNATHQHVELPLTAPRTMGYEIFAFTSGTFTLQGDGGFINWCFDGNFNRDGNNVTFFEIPIPPGPPPPPVGIIPPPATLTYPQREGVFLVNSSRGSARTSGFAYYKDCSQAQNNQPQAYIDIKTDGNQTWEGAVSSGTFQDGDAVEATVDTGAQDLPVGSRCGLAHNAFHNWNVYRDNIHPLYTIDGWTVNTVYLCS
ncbi:Hypothetical protein R9X50_00072400 [Acrodontium crateriforme]|uniref:Uncharacterized protein n=1 Tax=Acrodontium crateriforme TaxID=150365 RepID=A0AAQ3LXS9_9PEZI|nr:Hypothetical protein R9X50_00072400 [Acrodontium crateriforme]